jgi:hypothetical protein
LDILTINIFIGGIVFKLLKGGYCRAPEDLGVKDILIGLGKILKVEENIS